MLHLGYLLGAFMDNYPGLGERTSVKYVWLLGEACLVLKVWKRVVYCSGKNLMYVNTHLILPNSVIIER